MLSLGGHFLSFLAFLCTSVLLPWSATASALDPAKMAHHLEAGKPILGSFSDPRTLLTRWMYQLPDSTPIQEINVPGTHDTCAWNYTGSDAQTINTQDLPIFNQLNAGIRFLDIRFGLDNSTGKLRVYHGDALLSSTVELEDVLWGLYYFLDHHPTETLLVSLKVDHGSVSVPVQLAAHALITAAPVNKYWVQSTTLPPNLGASRGKIVLFRRFGFDTGNPDLNPVGLDVSAGWADNNPDFVITYSSGNNAYIEDLYQLNGDADQVPPAVKVQQKFDALTSHITNAQGAANTSQVFISFASGYGDGAGNVLTPKTLALGIKAMQIEGINQRVDQWLAKGSRQHVGIVLYDFFESQPSLVRRTIGI